MAKQVVIDTDECIGCETCVELCPEIFAFDEDAEKAHVIKAEGGDQECIDEAVGSCPAGCITHE
ncbi:MAG: ferredoxin [Desulfobulbaceae bacterium]|nr:ferredoxin [Desulfobulbaceae bacterium]